MARVCFSIDYSKRLSKCKKCNAEISKGKLRLEKILVNNSPGMKMYYHVECLFHTFHRGRYTTRAIESVDDIDGFADIKQKDQKTITDLIKVKSKLSGNACERKKNYTHVIASGSSKEKKLDAKANDADTKHNPDDRFEVFQTICKMTAEHRGYLQKTQILKSFFQKGKLRTRADKLGKPSFESLSINKKRFNHFSF